MLKLKRIGKFLDYWFNPIHIFSSSQFRKGYGTVRGKQLDAIGGAMQKHYSRKQLRARERDKQKKKK